MSNELVVTLYNRKDCHLCEQARADLQTLQDKIPHRLVEIDIESDPDLHKKFLTEIPVVVVGPYRKKAPFNQTDLFITLSAARDRKSQLDQFSDAAYQGRLARGQAISSGDRVSAWIANHYMLLVNLMFALYLGLPFLAPVLMKSGAELPARAIYTVYSPLCHELGFRSF
ncbi:MAG TPA: glutaredoxin family protein, partial [Pseudomonadales bacterium]|nr:glutaredoxin family protein [Pseudomonadales bacterium]